MSADLEHQGRLLAALLYNLRLILGTGRESVDLPPGHREAAQLAYGAHNEALSHLDGILFDEAALLRRLGEVSQRFDDDTLLERLCEHIKTPNRAVHGFATAARAYCELIEGGGVNAAGLLRALARLQILVLDLPDLNDASVEAADGTLPPIPKLNLENDIYWLVFDPLTTLADEPVAGSLADDLSDIRSDMRRGLQLYDDGHLAAACWEWRFNYQVHWGAHLAGAQAALSALYRW